MVNDPFTWIMTIFFRTFATFLEAYLNHYAQYSASYKESAHYQYPNIFSHHWATTIGH